MDPRTNSQTQSIKNPQVQNRLESNVPGKHSVTVEDVQRVLEVGRLLLSVLTEEEIQALKRILIGVSEERIGNTGVT
jgi:hypothetical protein